MLWFNGSIAEAVMLSKQRKTVFVVFIEGQTEEAAEFAAVFNNPEIVNKLSDESKFLVIKVKGSSVAYSQFVQIYHLVPIPSLFFIGSRGSPLEVLSAVIGPEALSRRIDKVLAEHVKRNNEWNASQNLIQSEASTSAATSSKAEAGKPSSKAEAGNPSSNVEADKSSSNVEAGKPSSSVEADKSSSNVEASKLSSNVEADKSSSNVEADKSSSNLDAAKPSSNVQNASSSSEVKAEKTPEPSKDSDPTTEVVCEGGVCERRPIRKPEESLAEEPSTEQFVQEAAPPEQPPTVDEKVERARELLEIRRRENELKEKELAKQKENERRSTGQSVAQLKRWQAEQEYKQIQEDRKREKLENHIAREKILKQIAQDRAEQKSKGASPPTASGSDNAPQFTQSQQVLQQIGLDRAEQTKAKKATPQPSPAQHDNAILTQDIPPETSNEVRIHIKLPDGKSLVNTFTADDKLKLVQEFIVASTTLKASSFSLWTAFPRRELAALDSTLTELQLAPSAALLVLLKAENASVSTAKPFYAIYSFLTSIFTTLVANPLNNILTWIQSRFNPSPPRHPDPAPHPPPQADAPRPGLRYRPPTNIRRMVDDSHDDDDNNTWNGNSTQQM